MLLVAAIILMFSFINTSPEIDVAIKDAKTIKNLVEGGLKRDWHEIYVNDILAISEKQSPNFPINVKMPNINLSIGLSPYYKEWTTDKDLPRLQNTLLRDEKISNFKELWNALNTSKTISIPVAMPWVASYDETSDEFKYMQRVSPSEGEMITPTESFRLVSTDDNGLIEKCFGDYKFSQEFMLQDKLDRLFKHPDVNSRHIVCGNTTPFGGTQGFDFSSARATNIREIGKGVTREEALKNDIKNVNNILFIAVQVSDIKYLPLSKFIDFFPKEVLEGEFSASFSELATISSNYDDLQIEKVITILEGEKSRAGGNLEAFGANIPIVFIRDWGFLLLIGLQAYFYLHLKELVKIISLSSNYNGISPEPWVGLYEGKMARYSFILFSIALPFIAVTLVVAKSHLLTPGNNLISILITLGFAGTSLILAFFQYKSIYAYSIVNANTYAEDSKE